MEPPGTESDRALATRVVGEGDEEAFRDLFDRHSPRLLRFALRLTGGAAAAEDVVQETWLRAVQGLGGFGWRSSLPTWLQGIALNVSRESWRRPDAAPNGAPLPEAGAREGDGRHRRYGGSGDRADRIDLERALARLPTGRRTVVVLHDLYGYKHAEIAESLGISVGTSKSQLHAARRDLELLLTGGEPDGRDERQR